VVSGLHGTGLVDDEEVALEYHSCRVQVINLQVSIYRIRLPGTELVHRACSLLCVVSEILVSYPIHLSPGSTSGAFSSTVFAALFLSLVPGSGGSSFPH